MFKLIIVVLALQQIQTFYSGYLSALLQIKQYLLDDFLNDINGNYKCSFIKGLGDYKKWKRKKTTTPPKRNETKEIEISPGKRNIQ